MDDEDIHKVICYVMKGTKFTFEMRSKECDFKIV